MRNNYIVLTLCLGLLSVNGLSQNAYVTGNQKVKVNPNTLVYFGSDLQVSANVTAEKVIENAGNIYVNGNFVNQADPDMGKNFVSTWTNGDSYGQVIIKETSTAQGLTMEKGPIDPSVFEWGQFAIPFEYSTAEDAMQALFGGPYVSTNRYYSSMMLWDNTEKPQFKTVFGNTPLNPGDYVILNLKYYSTGIKGIMEEAVEDDSILAYSGKPTNGALSGPTELVMNADMYFHGEAWDTWKEYKNDYNEKYIDYISDEVRPVTNDDYARNHFQFGNPYTSNLDLSKLPDIGFGNDLVGVAQYKAVEWDQGTGSSYANSVKATYKNGIGWAGDAEALIVKPFEPFILVLDEGKTGVVELSFGDNLKTFSMDPHYTPSTNKTSSDDLDGNSDFAGKNQYTGATLVGSLRGFYQLELKLYDEAENFTGNKAFVVVSDKVANGVENRLEAEYADFGNRTGFYLAQENANGSPVAESSRKMYINTVGMSYNNKPIPFFFARKSGDHNGYYIKANLFKDNIFNKLTSEERNYGDGNSFYFYDFKEDKLIPITTDFKYYIPGSTVALENRYQIYWNGLQNHNKSELSEDLSSVVVYKDQDTHKVRFSEDWDNAEVKVYDLTGRKVLEFNNVSTKADFAFKLPANGIYVVKIVSNTGEVYTQKIIK